MKSIILTGLDAQNPLGFLAALGLLAVLEERYSDTRLRPRLSFDDSYRPQLFTSLTVDQVVETVLEDALEQATNPLLNLAYDDDGTRLNSKSPSARRDLKPKPAVAREILLECAVGARRLADLAAGFFSELVQDNNGNTKPTALHFTAGQQAFLGMADALRVGLTRENLMESLLGPWKGSSPLPSLSWDSSVTRMYALRASDPSQDKRGSVPAANWLGVQALGFFAVAKQGRNLSTTCFSGSWKDSLFMWPVWSSPASAPVVASLLRIRTKSWTERQRQALGIRTVLSSRVLRSDQGGYGSFTPAEVVLPRASI